MTRDHVKTILSALWLFAALGIATDLKISWTTGALLALFGLFPPFAFFFLWGNPAPTLVEIQDPSRP
jgi:hypothetical protein